MSGKRAFTLVETVITVAIVCGTVFLWAYIMSAGRTQSEKLDEDQLYNHMKAEVLFRLKKDIRSSVAITQQSENAWEIETIDDADNEFPVIEKVVYEINSAGNIIFVTKGGKTRNYDFSKILNGKKLNFKIMP